MARLIRFPGAMLLLVSIATAAAWGQNRYRPCLGCAEHVELRQRWHKPLLELLGAQVVLFGENDWLEARASHMGLCENDPLARGSARPGIPGCHAFSLSRALVLELPLEILIFYSPAWGLARSGHPRWGMAWGLVPILAHAWAIRQTTEAIHQWEREQLLLH